MTMLLTVNFLLMKDNILFGSVFLATQRNDTARPYPKAGSPPVGSYHRLLGLPPHSVTYQTVLNKKTLWCELSKSSPYLTSPSRVGFISKLKGIEGLGKSKDQPGTGGSQQKRVPGWNSKQKPDH